MRILNKSVIKCSLLDILNKARINNIFLFFYSVLFSQDHQMSCFKTKYQKLLTKDETNRCIKIMLQEKFPFKIYLTCLFVNIFFGCCAIGFQIALISVKGPLYYVGAG